MSCHLPVFCVINFLMEVRHNSPPKGEGFKVYGEATTSYQLLGIDVLLGICLVLLLAVVSITAAAWYSRSAAC